MKQQDIRQVVENILEQTKQTKLAELHAKQTATDTPTVPAGLTPYSKALLKMAAAIREIENGQNVTPQDMEWFVELANNAISRG